MEESFFDTVWRLCAMIPRGKVASYGSLALMAGHPRAARQVGQAMRRAPEGLPCHRVVKSDGTFPREDLFGVPGLQRSMLMREGVLFLPDGRIDMARCQWDGRDRTAL